MIADTGAGIGTNIGSGVTALTSQLDRLNDGISKSLVFGSRGDERESLPSLDDVFDSARPRPLQQLPAGVGPAPRDGSPPCVAHAC